MTDYTDTKSKHFKKLLTEKILILDGAMGTMIQLENLSEEEFQKDLDLPQDKFYKGNNELLNLSQPQIIESIHLKYLQAGANIIETNTFGANKIAQKEYGLEHLVKAMNRRAVEVAISAKQKYHQNRDNLFIAGALGPTSKTASIGPDVQNPGYRNVSFEDLRQAYYEQVEALVTAGVDILLIETIFDTLNAKAAIFATEEYFEDSARRLPVMISGTVTDASGRILSGQTVKAFWYSVRHAKPIAVGLNCALGAALMRPYIQELATIAPDTFIVCYPNAGLPNPMSETGFDEDPETTSTLLKEFAQSDLVNIVGGCCGTTPKHIEAIVQAVKDCPPRTLSDSYLSLAN
ncbi:MAG: homocysteine S-methyltransferase family protein [Gammaproteobacteria bacterium]|nr:homocysteine S-methyltransferase family protein [Gammaproteobacteria bacterium]